MKLYPTKPCCGADHTFQTSVIPAFRGRTRKTQRWVRDVQIHHIKGEARFWHWKDQTDDLKAGAV